MLKKFKKLRRSNQFFLLLLPLAVVLAGSILFFSSQKYLKESECGCGPPPADATGEYDFTAKTAVFNGKAFKPDWISLFSSTEVHDAEEQEKAVLGISVDERWIEIDLSDQRLYAHEGDKVVYNFLISGGKWAPTPKGDFRVWIKLKYAKMSGGNPGTNTYYYLPNVPYIQYFYKGYGLHGAYWHNNFGNPMSHGCVNLSIPDSQKLFYWTSPPVPPGRNIVYPTKDNPGTRVIIHD